MEPKLLALRAFRCASLLIAAFPAAAQTPPGTAGYPSKPVRMLVGFAAGGTADLVARSLAQKLHENLGQPFAIDNRGGANSAIATELLARAAPDGYTLMTNAAGHVTNPSLMKLPFDPVKDFAFITLVAESVNLLVVHPSLPPKSVKELIAFSRRHPGELNFPSQGTGSTGHLSGELFQYLTGVKWVHIPYKGSAAALPELLAGQTSLMFPNLPAVLPHARAGKLRALAVTGAKRSSAAPDIPTVAESGVAGFEVTNWFGVAAPAKTPRAIVERLHSEIVRALNSADLRERLESQGADVVGNTPEQYTAFIQGEIAKWAKVIQSAGVKGE